ncbi:MULTISPECIES: chloride channel protein [unclassified Ruegeria]|uniref:chloride channel protein n=1 Tax=unclassified Ruegeria TaxID=2625375 RepID=UPI001488D1FE|nr:MULTISPECIES: chloride channel protein [unclassified Ruegeria]NOD74759.1 chloride channel protein [Ruegeria sp. HKCCD4332]NOD88508.1 chloride channel protein [Ruegeria sp. HKCCD4318]NOE12264.1 chloride channel protein [Ruegeria sp. HKCCD4318-2]NOG09571.1 chloride channel protein [Ruegeria sp. HKCCD4315]
MTQSTRTVLRNQFNQALAAIKDAWRVMLRRGPSQIQFWFIALAIGIAAGFMALGFRKAIRSLQAYLYDTDDILLLHSHAEKLPWFMVLIIPIVGGLLVGVILNRFTNDGRVRSVADVIEGAAVTDGRVEVKAGIASFFASLITLSSGGSTGREGPVVHMAGVISTWVSNRIHADGITGRDLLGCAVAAAVSASFNAPIAGALFALEVVLRHFAVHAFAPIVIASVAGTVINRLEYGDVTEFTLDTPGSLQFYVELPAFLILGLICGFVALLLMRSIFFAEDIGSHIQSRLSIPGWLRPAVSGAMLGLMAIWFPHIIGVGYETTIRALTGDLVLTTAILFAVTKTVAVAITMGGRMGGGVFSPSLMVGALTGLAFGLIATGLLPDVSGTHTLYAFAGMGAVAAAVLGAPISTTLIVFELTGDWQIGLAVMVTVSMSTALASRLVDRSFFLTQLERRDVHLAAGPQAYLLAMLRAGAVMRPIGDPRSITKEEAQGLIEQGLCIQASATLEAAMPYFDRADIPCIPVVILDADGTETPVGALYHIDALKAYNRALAATAAEEHS